MKHIKIQGSGSSGESSSQRAPVEAPNTLQSNSTGQILDLLAFGPIKGIVGGAKGVYLDDTQVQNPDGSYNFDGIVFEERQGDPDQDYMPGFQAVANAREINTEIKLDSPVVRAVNNPDATSVIVTVRVPSLVKQDTKTGDTKKHELPLAIHIQSGGSWYSAVSDTIAGKNTSPYERSYRIQLKGSGPYSIRVQRLNKESDKSDISDALFWSSMTEVVDVKHSYPYCALAGITVEARLFGNSLPSRKYLTDLSIIKVPSNYDPVTRVYSGLWDGTFKNAWSDNPAWCFYDLATHPIIGAGIEDVNKFALYEIGKYCDALVPDGYGGMEPRFTCNTLFAAQEDAITALNTLASVFRGMAYWGSNTVEPVADMPKPISRIITTADVIEGEFTYRGTALKERHSVAVVSWNDPDDGYETKPEMIENAEMVDLVGWRELRITAVACTSRGQARRLGLWALYSEQMETQTLEFTTTIKNADLRPGDIIQVHDPYRAGARLAGRLTGVVSNRLYLDSRPAEVSIGWKIVVETNDKGLSELTINAVGPDYVQVNSLPVGILPTGGFALTGNSYKLPHFRVVSVTEGKSSHYSVTATEYNPGKYDHIELGLELPDAPSSLLPTGQLKAPKSIDALAYRYLEGNAYHQGLTIGWRAPDDSRVERYILDVKGPDDVAYRTIYTGLGLSYDEFPISPGSWQVRVRADSSAYGKSTWVSKSVFAEDMLIPSPPTAISLDMKTMSATIRPRHPFVGQEFELYRSMVAIPEEAITSSSVFIGTGTYFEDTDLMIDTEYHYYARSVNNHGKSGFVHASGRTLADAENILNLLLEQYQKSEIGKWFQAEIEKISGDSLGSVNDRINNLDFNLELGEIEDRLDALDQLFNFADFDPLREYLQGTLVSKDGVLYSAIKDVPAGIEPPNPEYWKDVGTYDSLGDVLTGLAAQITLVDTKVTEVDGKLTAQATKVEGLWSSMHPAMAGSTTDYAGAESAMAGVYSLLSVITDGDSALASRIDALTAEINGNIRALIQAESEVRATADEALATLITTLRSQIETDIGIIQGAIQTEANTRATADEALATLITTLRSQIETDIGIIQGAIQTEANTRATADEALATLSTALSSKVETEVSTLQGAILSEATTRASADDAITTQLSALSSRVTTDILDVQAAITSESLTRASADQALTVQTNQAISIAQAKNRTYRQSTAPTGALTVGDIWYKENEDNKAHRWDGTKWVVTSDESLKPAVAAVQTQVTTLATQSSAQAQQIQGVQASVGTHSSLIQQVTNAQATVDGKLSAMWGIKMQVSSLTGRPVLAGVGLGIEGGSSAFTVLANQFRVVQNINGTETLPFAIKDGKVVMNSAIIGDATIDFAKITDTIQSTNWNASARTGWQLKKNGNFTIYGGSSGQGYILVNNDGMKVYDSAGRIRVKLGKL